MYTSKYPIVSVTADMVLITKDLELLLLRRNTEPHKGKWAFAGGFFDPADDQLEDCAIRETHEELGIVINPDNVLNCTTLSSRSRDPRGRTISQVFITLVDRNIPINYNTEVMNVGWIGLHNVQPTIMAFDHFEVVEMLRTLDLRSILNV